MLGDPAWQELERARRGELGEDRAWEGRVVATGAILEGGCGSITIEEVLAADASVGCTTGARPFSPVVSPFDPTRKAPPMKSMTCRQLGGPCDLAHRGDDANDVIKAQDRHLREAVAAGDSDHEPALREMKSRWRRPISGMKWYRQAQRDFAALPDEPGNG